MGDILVRFAVGWLGLVFIGFGLGCLTLFVTTIYTGGPVEWITCFGLGWFAVPASIGVVNMGLEGLRRAVLNKKEWF